ncbi:hypothetical protein AB4Y32_30600 [Paraburkholderia phymatum]|uniref:Uncharacterized protein n=1 Tax=Paraburkholderia phymatum TaxID=148447 RepID=A0ACC6U8R8_9BURK
MSERLGHSRVQVTASYFGPTPKNVKKADDEAAAQLGAAAVDVETVVNGSDAQVEPQRTVSEPVSDAREATGASLPTNQARSGTVRTTSADSGLPGAYYKNAPAGRKHPDDLETTSAEERAKAEEKKAGAAEAEKVAGSSNGASDRNKSAGGAEGSAFDERRAQKRTVIESDTRGPVPALTRSTADF